MSYDTHLATAVTAARKAGAFLREHYETDMVVNEASRHDIKLELDVRSQQLITDVLLGDYPDHALFGEEGIAGSDDSEWQWIVDPIDGTVNYFYGIPHFCVSIALRRGRELVLGVIYDPMLDELWSAIQGNPATLNGKPIKVSNRDTLGDSVITVGFSKTVEGMERGFSRFEELAYKVRKTRMLGSAALAMSYIACGRLDAYIEGSISLWDIAAGIVIIEAAGGTVLLDPPDHETNTTFSIVAHNGKLPLP